MTNKDEKTKKETRLVEIIAYTSISFILSIIFYILYLVLNSLELEISLDIIIVLLLLGMALGFIRSIDQVDSKRNN